MKCALAVFLAFLLSASLSAPAWSSDTSTLVPEEQEVSSLSSNQSMLQTAQTSLSDSTTLRQRLETRKRQAQAQVESWQAIVEALKKEIAQGKQESTDLSAKLAKAEAELVKSQMDLTETLQSLDASKATSESLSVDFEKYKAKVNKELRAKKLELWIWRGCTLIGVVACGYFAFR